MVFPKGKDKLGEIAKRPMCGVKIPTEKIIEALTKSHGNISRAADSLKCARQTIHSRIDNEIEIKEVYEHLRERFIDVTEDVLRDKVLSGDTACVLFALKTRGRKRGYDSERDVIVESATRGVLDFIVNRSKNPAES
jgi:hypothetical protein